jgi:hypothetical protein
VNDFGRKEADDAVTYDVAIDNAVGLLRRANRERESAETYGHDATAGDSGIPCLTLAAQYTAEAQAWVTVAHAVATWDLVRLEAGV